MHLLPVFAFGVLAIQPATATASSSAWFETEGGRIRLVTTGAPDEAGKLSGVLQIHVKPGWKTYWRDPGDAGVPPTIDISKNPNIASAELSYPAPERFDDGYAKWAGYKHPVDLPVAFTLKSPAGSAVIEADIFLGVCETICIPVQSVLTLDPASDPDNADDAVIVDAALAALPGPEQPDFGVTLLPPAKADELLVEAIFPGDPAVAEFFLAASGGYAFATPERRDEDGKVRFIVPVLDRPAAAPAEGALHYTLVTGAGAVAGMLPFP